MALTKNGRRVGMAAHNERIFNADYVEQIQHEEIRRKQDEFADLMDQLKETSDWEIWYDDDNNVPDFTNSDWDSGRLEIQIQALKRYLNVVSIVPPHGYGK